MVEARDVCKWMVWRDWFALGVALEGYMDGALSIEDDGKRVLRHEAWFDIFMKDRVQI